MLSETDLKVLMPNKTEQACDVMCGGKACGGTDSCNQQNCTHTTRWL